MFNTILVVCTGNVCRSPIAERLLRCMLPNGQIESAGTHALQGHDADPAAVRVAAQHNLPLTGHVSRQFIPVMATKYNLILVMEKSHIAKITKIAPEARSKCMLLGHWMDHADIPDPWRKSDEAFEHVYQMIDRACQMWASKLGQ